VGLGAVVLTTLPARIALATDQAQGLDRALFVLGGLLVDLSVLGPFSVLLVMLTLPLQGRKPLLGFAALCGVTVLLGLGHNAAMEFKLQRGVLPGLVDLRAGASDADFVRSELQLLFFGRYVLGNVVALVCLLALGRAALLLSRHHVDVRRRAAVHATAIGVLLLFGLHRAAAAVEHFCSGLHNIEAVASPARVLVAQWMNGDGNDGSAAEILRVMKSAPGSPDELRRGARAFGFDANTADALLVAESKGQSSAKDRCAAHPLRRELDEPGTPLVDAAREVSGALFAHRDVRPVVFHVSFESVRGDDVHALSPAAPEALVPFVNRAYESPQAVGFRHAHQSGVRTAQALGAVICGMGTLPFNLALGRDLGSVPLRCAADVLGSAGFSASAFYGHEFAFDGMNAFLKLHGLSLYERQAYPLAAPRGVWRAVSDASVYALALENAQVAPTTAQYNFVLTMSHHTPYTLPEDLSERDAAPMRALCKTRGLTGEHCDRILTLRYASETLGNFIAAVEESPLADRAVIVVAADHTTHQWFPWGDKEPPQALTQIPMFVWFPAQTLGQAKDPARAARALGTLRHLANTQALSNADVPALVLGLLHESKPVRELPSEHRWHTLGGAVTSRNYQSPLSDGALHGIDAHGALFEVSADGTHHPRALIMERLGGPDSLRSAASYNRAPAAFLGSFLRGYGERCGAELGRAQRLHSPASER